MDKKLSEPTVGYCRAGLQDLKERLIASIESCVSVEDLEQCMGILQMDSMPCVYTDDEFRQVLKRAEAEGNANDEEVRKFFAGWGVSI